MTVLTRALQRIEQDRRAATDTPAVEPIRPSAGLLLKPPATKPLAIEPPVVVTPPPAAAGYESLAIVIDAPAALAPMPLEASQVEAIAEAAEPIESPALVDTPVELEASSPPPEGSQEPESSSPLAMVGGTLDQSGHDEPNHDEPNFGKLIAQDLGDVLLACDLSESNEAGRLLAAGVAIEGRATLSDDVAIVLLGDAEPRDFVETNEPGLYSCGFHLDPGPSTCRRLLLLIDDCRQRFRRTVLLIDGRDESAVALVAPRVDQVLLLGERRQTPESHLLRMENHIRRQAPLARPRLVVAA